MMMYHIKTPLITSRASSNDNNIILGLIWEKESHAVGKVSDGNNGLEHLAWLFNSALFFD